MGWLQQPQCFMGWFQQMCARISFIFFCFSSFLLFLLSITLSFFFLSLSLYPTLHHYLSLCSPLFSTLLSVEENTFVMLDHSGIGVVEFVSMMEETEFTISIEAFPAPKVTWLKDGIAITENSYFLTKTSRLEGNQ